MRGRRHRVTTAVDGAAHSGCSALEDGAKEVVGGELPAPRCDEAGLDRVGRYGVGADTVRAAMERCRAMGIRKNVESRLQTPCKNEAASAHGCDDEGKEDDRCDERHRASHCGAVTERGGAAPCRRGRSHPAKKTSQRASY